MKHSKKCEQLVLVRTDDKFYAKIEKDLVSEVNGVLILSPEEVQELLPTLFEYLSMLERKNLLFESKESVTELQQLLCDVFEIDSIDTLISKSRKKPVVIARQLMFTILRWTGYGGIIKIGKVGNRDHATVLASVKAIRSLIDTRDKTYYGSIMKVLNRYHINATNNIQSDDKIL